MPETRCACGQPLHYTDSRTKVLVDRLIATNGENVRVVVGRRAWLVPRHYIALHGLKADDLPHLGFVELRVHPGLR